MQGKEVTTTNNYYIIDYQIPIERLIYVIRDHWSIECRINWILDMIMNKDHSRNRDGNLINNLSLLRKIVFNLINLDKGFGEKVSLKRKLTRYMLDDKNIENLIFNVLPSI